jgi:hypothetical protein
MKPFASVALRGVPDLDLAAERLELADESVDGLRLVVPVEMVGTEVAIGDSITEHVIDVSAARTPFWCDARRDGTFET